MLLMGGGAKREMCMTNEGQKRRCRSSNFSFLYWFPSFPTPIVNTSYLSMRATYWLHNNCEEKSALEWLDQFSDFITQSCLAGIWRERWIPGIDRAKSTKKCNIKSFYSSHVSSDLACPPHTPWFNPYGVLCWSEQGEHSQLHTQVCVCASQPSQSRHLAGVPTLKQSNPGKALLQFHTLGLPHFPHI